MDFICVEVPLGNYSLTHTAEKTFNGSHTFIFLLSVYVAIVCTIVFKMASHSSKPDDKYVVGINAVIGKQLVFFTLKILLYNQRHVFNFCGDRRSPYGSHLW